MPEVKSKSLTPLYKDHQVGMTTQETHTKSILTSK